MLIFPLFLATKIQPHISMKATTAIATDFDEENVQTNRFDATQNQQNTLNYYVRNHTNKQKSSVFAIFKSKETDYSMGSFVVVRFFFLCVLSFSVEGKLYRLY